LKTIAYGGAPSTPDLIGRVLEDLPAVDLHHVYGGTEAAVVLHLGPEEHRSELLDSVGREVSGVEVRLVDGKGVEVPIGEPGELTVRSNELLTGYWRDAEATAEVLKDGIYWSGDIGVRDDLGYMRLVGRRTDVVISGGFNVYPIEVENVLAGNPEISEVAVIGIPHERWGEAVHAVVVRTPGSTVPAEELLNFCSGRIASYKRPKSVEIVDELPRTSVGKIAKNVLREERIGALG
jgi:long-chain acyl-CoA synthetase